MNMTQEEKELLLKDLFNRLLYGVNVLDEMGRTYKLQLGNACLIDLFYGDVDYMEAEAPILPYLRPMESMTSKEESEICKILGCGCINVEYAYFNWSVGGCCDKDDMNIDIKTFGIVVEWLNSHYFDYRNLIEKGLALPAPEGMYNKMEE